MADELPSLQVADVAIDPSEPSRVFAAILDQDRVGSGIYRSDNAGSTWTLVSSDQRLNGRILLIDPTRGSVMFMAGVEAIYRSDDAGATWRAVLVESGGIVTDLVMDRTNPQRLYAGLLGDSRGAGGIYTTGTGGTAWERLTGCPGGRLPEMGSGTTVRLALSGSRVYAGLKASSNDWDLYRTTGVGCITEGRSEQVWERGWHVGPELGATIWSFLYADPVNPDFVYATGTNFRVSTDGGMSFSVASGPHVDHHAFAADPTNPAIIYTGSDGGIYRSSNRGVSGSWSFIGRGMTNTEMYDLAQAVSDADVLIAGTQDNGTIRYQRPNTTWSVIRDGDGAGVEIDPTDATNFFGVGQYANSIARSTGGGGFQTISHGLPIGTDCFNMPFQVHPTVPTTLLASCGALWRTTTSAPPGDWKKILEAGNDRVMCSAVEPTTDLYVAGTNRGNIYVGLSGTGWTQAFRHADVVLNSSSPSVTDLQFDADVRGSMFATFDTDGAGRVFSMRVGQTSLNPLDITSDLPPGRRVRTIAVDRMNTFSLFVGVVQGGVYQGTSSDNGTTWRWRQYRDGIPFAVDIRRLIAHPRTGVLRAGTFGRGAFEVDTDWPLGGVLAAEGLVSELRVVERGSRFGPPTDQIEAEVVFRLDSVTKKAFGFQLRTDSREAAHRGMLGLLRDAFRDNGRIRVEYARSGIHNNTTIRVIRMS